MRWLICVLLLPCLVFGQTNDRRRAESEAFNKQESVKNQGKNAYWKSGNFALTPKLGLIDLGYNSNIYSTPANEQDDLLATPELGLDAWAKISPKWFWRGSATYSYRYYADQDRLRKSEYNLGSVFYGLFKRVYLETGIQAYQDNRQQSSEQDIPVTTKRNSYDVNAVIQVVPRGHLVAHGRIGSIEYDRAADLVISENYLGLDRDESLISLNYLHKLKAKFWPFIGVKKRDFAFDQKSKDSDFTTIFGGLRNEKGERLHFNVEVGFEELSFDFQPQIDEKILTTSSILEYSFSRGANLTLGVQRQPVFSFDQAFAYFLSSRYFVDLGYSLGKTTLLGGGLMVGENAYEANLQTTAKRQDDVLILDINLKFTVAKSFDLSIQTAYQKRDSDTDIFTFEGMTLYADIRYLFR